MKLIDVMSLLIPQMRMRRMKRILLCWHKGELVITSMNLFKQPTSHDRTYGAWKELIKLIPSIKTSIVNLDPHALGTYYSMLMKGASDARSDDIRNIKIGVASWLNKYPSTRPPLNPEDRLSRGFQHDTIGRLLCPVEFDWNNMEVRAKLRACEDGFDPSSSFFIRCLYPSNTADPNDVENGFLRGSLLVKTFSTIFTSPSSAQHIKDDHNDDTENFPSLTRHTLFKSPKSNIATKLQLENVTPCAIAYSADLQLHFSLTDAPSWKATYNSFSYEDFYNFVIDYFEDTPTVVAKDNSHALLKWWNKQIFPGRSKANKNTHSSRCRLEEQRAARA
ncbi:hypothetical protein BDZ94DRAFT_1196493, partial [Collybia nuda]